MMLARKAYRRKGNDECTEEKKNMREKRWEKRKQKGKGKRKKKGKRWLVAVGKMKFEWWNGHTRIILET